MSTDYELDNIVVLYDEDGNEIEFEILHEVSYEGKTYCVVWSEDTDDMAIVSKEAGDYEVVDDEDVIDYVRKSFSADMASLSEQIDNLSDDVDSLLASIDETLGNNGDADPYDDTVLDVTDSTSIKFDLTKYMELSATESFENGCVAHHNDNYSEAFDSFKQAISEGNIFAYAHMGMLFYYGEGCEQDYYRAFQYFTKGADAGCPLATAWQAECYRLGYGVEKDKDKASQMYCSLEHAIDDMCDAGDDSAQYFHGFNLIMGVGYPENEVKGLWLLRQATEKGNSRAAVQLAECYLNAWGTTQDYDKAISLLQRYAHENNKKGQFLLGTCFYYGKGVAKDLNKAFTYLLRSAKLGFGKARNLVGDCYYEGTGVIQNYEQAAEWYKLAMDENNNSSAAHSLGFMYLHGDGVAKNVYDAYDCFKFAADRGVWQAQRLVADAYVAGDIWGRDYEKAREWMLKAAEAGDPRAQVALGRYYVSDFGFDSDEQSFHWFMEAAKQGFAEAERIVGQAYLNDFAVDYNEKEANKWLSLAVEHGDALAIYELGVSYRVGRGYPKNSTKGMELYLQAADKGVQEAYRELALSYYQGIEDYKGQKLYKDFNEARRFALLAAQDEDDHSAKCILATILCNAFSDTSGAEDWYMKAVQSGHKGAMVALSRMYIDHQNKLDAAVTMLQKVADSNYATERGEAQFWLAVCLEFGYGCKKDKQGAQRYYSLAEKNGYHGTKPKKKLFGLF